MSLRTHLVFEADFPEDGVWTQSGAVVQPSGLNIASALTEMLKHKDFEVSKPTSIESYGWDFTVSGVVWFVLQCPGPWLLLSKNNGPLMQKVFNPKALALTHRDVLEKVNALLHQDSRFHDIRWFTKEDYEKNKDSDRAAWSSEP